MCLAWNKITEESEPKLATLGEALPAVKVCVAHDGIPCSKSTKPRKIRIGSRDKALGLETSAEWPQIVEKMKRRERLTKTMDLMASREWSCMHIWVEEDVVKTNPPCCRVGGEATKTRGRHGGACTREKASFGGSGGDFSCDCARGSDTARR
jgi:hypothetical protein